MYQYVARKIVLCVYETPFFDPNIVYLKFDFLLLN